MTKLTKSQREWLAKVCQTNGGGVGTYFSEGAVPKPIRALHELGLVQGKANQAGRVVHTREGMALYRALVAGATS